MSKSYWHSIGSGSLGMSGPWNAPSISGRRRRLSAPGRILEVIIASVLLSFFAGIAIGLFRHIAVGTAAPGDIGAYAYAATGMWINTSFAWILATLGFDNQIVPFQNNVLAFWALPYEVCAFEGAYATTAIINGLGHIVTVLASHP